MIVCSLSVVLKRLGLLTLVLSVLRSPGPTSPGLEDFPGLLQLDHAIRHYRMDDPGDGVQGQARAICQHALTGARDPALCRQRLGTGGNLAVRS
jgi:hypothetical protein